MSSDDCSGSDSEHPTIYAKLMSEDGALRLNIKDVERLVTMLIKIMGFKISETDFFHDKAFSCLFQLMYKVTSRDEK